MCRYERDSFLVGFPELSMLQAQEQAQDLHTRSGRGQIPTQQPRRIRCPATEGLLPLSLVPNFLLILSIFLLQCTVSLAARTRGKTQYGTMDWNMASRTLTNVL